MKTKIVVSIFIFFALLQIAPRAYQALAAPSFPQSTLTIATQTKTYPFRVEIARTDEQMEHGLMFRQSIAEDAGMLFINKEPHIITMWMKNTLIPLDMLFMDKDGTITKIVENAKPESTDVISSDQPELAVLEMKGGAAKLYDIKPGDTVVSEDLRHP